jgi:hypothetical protein
MHSEGKLKHVSRGLLADGYENFKPAMGYQTRRHWDALRTYFNALEATIRELKPIAEKININNTIVSMVCNFGQSSLLMNFACSSRACGFDISNVLVFATDRETLELAQSLGLNAYFDEKVSIDCFFVFVKIGTEWYYSSPFYLIRHIMLEFWATT